MEHGSEPLLLAEHSVQHYTGMKLESGSALDAGFKKKSGSASSLLSSGSVLSLQQQKVQQTVASSGWRVEKAGARDGRDKRLEKVQRGREEAEL
jgi:hypothetical protein